MLITHKKIALCTSVVIIAIFMGYIPRYHSFMEQMYSQISHGDFDILGLIAVGISGVFIVAYPQAFNRQYSPRFSKSKEKLMTKAQWRIIGYLLTGLLFVLFEIMKN